MGTAARRHSERGYGPEIFLLARAAAIAVSAAGFFAFASWCQATECGGFGFHAGRLRLHHLLWSLIVVVFLHAGLVASLFTERATGGARFGCAVLLLPSLLGTLLAGASSSNPGVRHGAVAAALAALLGAVHLVQLARLAGLRGRG